MGTCLGGITSSHQDSLKQFGSSVVHITELEDAGHVTTPVAVGADQTVTRESSNMYLYPHVPIGGPADRA